MGNFVIKIYDDRPGEFWVTMGPAFASTKVRRELPYIRDEPGYIWFVARDEDGGLAGFASLHTDAQGQGFLHGLYVQPNFRGDGLARQLLETRLAYLQAIGVKRIQVTANGRSRPLLEMAGFTATAKKGTYQVMVKDL